MKAHIAKSAIGYFAFDDNQKLLFYRLFKPSAAEASKKIHEGVEKSFIEMLKGYDAIEDDFAKKLARRGLRNYALTLGFSKSDREFNRYMASFGMELSRNKLGNVITKDLLLVQATKSLESVNRFSNILTEHFKEWFWLNYPEYKGDNEKIISELIEHGSRENFPGFSRSYGIKFEQKDQEIIIDFAKQVGCTSKLRKDMDAYVRGMAREVAPNFSYLIDEFLAARMIAAAGSMEKMSKLSAGTIQLLGAEKAMFRHVKNKQARPPKYGMLFETTYVKNAPEDRKGKAARVVASYLYKAIKIDFYSQRDDKDNLKKEMEKELGSIR